MNVANFDVAGVADRLTRYAKELLLSQSSNMTEFNEADRTRVSDWLDRLVDFMTAVNVPPRGLDLPRSHPTAYPIREFPTDDDINGIENAEIKDVVRRLKAGFMELTGSNSKDRASGFLEADTERLLKLIENIRAILTISQTTEDLPEQPSETPIVP